MPPRIALAVAASERHFALPEVPTFAELGFKGVEAATWRGVFVPKGTRSAIVEELRAAHAKVLADRSVQLLALAEMKRWGQVVKDANIPPE